MEYGVRTNFVEDPLDQISLTHVDGVNGNLWGEIVAAAAAEIIQNGDRVLPSQEGIDDMAANEARPPRH
jgi:hypothetical protein